MQNQYHFPIISELFRIFCVFMLFIATFHRSKLNKFCKMVLFSLLNLHGKIPG